MTVNIVKSAHVDDKFINLIGLATGVHIVGKALRASQWYLHVVVDSFSNASRTFISVIACTANRYMIWAL